MICARTDLGEVVQLAEAVLRYFEKVAEWYLEKLVALQAALSSS